MLRSSKATGLCTNEIKNVALKCWRCKNLNSFATGSGLVNEKTLINERAFSVRPAYIASLSTGNLAKAGYEIKIIIVACHRPFATQRMCIAPLKISVLGKIDGPHDLIDR